MKIINLIIFVSSFLSCRTKNGKETDKLVDEKKIPGTYVSDTIKPPLIKEIGQLNVDTCSIHWYGGGLFSLCFEKNQVSFFFTPQCIYTYHTKLDNNKIIFFWDYNADCVFDPGLKRSYRVSKQPKVGSPFGEFLLINDTTLEVKYYYADWVQKVNEHMKDVDTLFPKIFKMKIR